MDAARTLDLSRFPGGVITTTRCVLADADAGPQP